MRRRSAYLDTSIVLTKEFGLAQERIAVKRAIRQRAKIASSYIKLEVNRTFLTDMIFLHTLMVEERDIQIVFQRLRRFPITKRRVDRCNAILESVSDKGQLRIEDAIPRLENLILGIEFILYQNLDFIASGTNCPLAEEVVSFSYPYFDILTSCRVTEDKCSLVDFLSQNTIHLNNLLSNISADKDFVNLSTVLTRIRGNHKLAKGNSCKALGDTIICLDAPVDSEILSTNKKDFEKICESLGKHFRPIEF